MSAHLLELLTVVPAVTEVLQLFLALMSGDSIACYYVVVFGCWGELSVLLFV